jgi:predicted phosphodiesterase
MIGPTRKQPPTAGRVAARLVAVALIGAFAGLVIAVFTPAKVEIAGSSASVWLKIGRDYDQFGIDQVLSGKRVTTRSVLGEPIGVHADLHLDASELTDSAGNFNVDVLPAYIQAYSDPEQLVAEIRRALLVHFLAFAGIGAAAAALLWCARTAHRAWRAGYDRVHYPDRAARASARAYRAPERRLARRTTAALVAVVVLDAVPASVAAGHRPPPVTADPIFAGTPLAGVEVSGLLKPAIVAAQSYIQTYFQQTNTYYDELRAALDKRLAADPIELPGDETSVRLGFVTDRHCNIGMDRVVVALLKHFDVSTLVSAGDDAFSGTFGFESACTRNLADKTERAHIGDVFVGGNHDSPRTIAAEADQGITTLTGKVTTVHGLRFIGIPDPRTSRYGQGIVPSSDAAQAKLLTAQGDAAGRTACDASGPVIAVLHDPLAGMTALEHGCGKVVLALDGHTHKQADPVPVDLPEAGTGYQLTGGSAGGAPTESQVESTFASRLTVGPLNHDAWVSIVTVDGLSGALQGVTTFHFTPAQDVMITQRSIG